MAENKISVNLCDKTIKGHLSDLNSLKPILAEFDYCSILSNQKLSAEQIRKGLQRNNNKNLASLCSVGN